MIPKRPAGQAMTEFLVIAVAMGLALFYPYLDGRSVTTVLLTQLLEAMRARSFVVSIL